MHTHIHNHVQYKERDKLGREDYKEPTWGEVSATAVEAASAACIVSQNPPTPTELETDQQVKKVTNSGVELIGKELRKFLKNFISK